MNWVSYHLQLNASSEVIEIISDSIFSLSASSTIQASKASAYFSLDCSWFCPLVSVPTGLLWVLLFSYLCCCTDLLICVSYLNILNTGFQRFPIASRLMIKFLRSCQETLSLFYFKNFILKSNINCFDCPNVICVLFSLGPCLFIF